MTCIEQMRKFSDLKTIANWSIFFKTANLSEYSQLKPEAINRLGKYFENVDSILNSDSLAYL